jgi:hypothetical protein
MRAIIVGRREQNEKVMGITSLAQTPKREQVTRPDSSKTLIHEWHFSHSSDVIHHENPEATSAWNSVFHQLPSCASSFLTRSKLHYIIIMLYVDNNIKPTTRNNKQQQWRQPPWQQHVCGARIKSPLPLWLALDR